MFGVQGLNNDAGSLSDQGRALTSLGLILIAPLVLGSFLFWVMNSDGPTSWGLLVPVIVIDAVLTVALLPFRGDLDALRSVARQTGTFAFAWTTMVMAAAIYARLPIYLLAVLAIALTVAYTRTHEGAKVAARDNAIAYWGLAIIGQIVLLWIVLKVVMAASYSAQDLASGEEFVLHLDSLVRFAVFGVLGYFGAYQMSAIVAVKEAGSFHKRIAVGKANAWLAQQRLKPTPGNVREALKQMGVQGEPIHDAAEAAMTKAGYPAGFWFRHQASLGLPYGFLFCAGSVLAWFIGGLGWTLMLPVEFAADWNRSFYRVADELKPTTTDNKDGHTLV